MTQPQNRPEPPCDRPAWRRLAPLMVVLLFGFCAVGISLPVLPVYVHFELGFGAGWVGAVAGSHYLIAIFSRPIAGRTVDRRGGKPAVGTGLVLGALGGLAMAAALALAHSPALAVVLLVIARMCLGASESFLITGAIGWGITLVPPDKKAFAISWLGSAMFLAYAAVVPLGTVVYGSWGLGIIAGLTFLLPPLTLIILRQLQNSRVQAGAQAGYAAIARAIALPGLGLGLSSLGFGVLLSFAVLLFETRGWPDGWLPLTLFSVLFIAVRIVWGHLPDRIGGGRAAGISLIVQALGLMMLFAAPGPAWGHIGAALTGIGYALVFPGLGIEALRRVPPHLGGVAMAIYTASLDITLGLGIPALGLVADRFGLSSVFIVAAVSSLLAMCVSFSLARKTP